MLKISEIKTWDEKTIEAKKAELRKQYFELNMQKVTGGIEKPHIFRDIKKDIARCETALTELRANNA
ncbi:MAG: 50S ribosomal protein L29 [Bacteriovoracaceae bacterium]